MCSVRVARRRCATISHLSDDETAAKMGHPIHGLCGRLTAGYIRTMGISTHILDTAKGRPGAGVNVSLERMDGDFWEEVATGKTDADGRAMLLPKERPAAAGIYRISFDTASYYKKEKLKGLYPIVEIAFTVAKGQKHYHIPLLLTANGYSTYRGT